MMLMPISGLLQLLKHSWPSPLIFHNLFHPATHFYNIAYSSSGLEILHAYETIM